MKLKNFSPTTARRLILALFAALFSMTAQAADFNVTANGVTWRCTVMGSTNNVSIVPADKSAILGSVTIPASVKQSETNYTVTTIGDYAFENCSDLTSITIPASVTTIEQEAFCVCSHLTSVTFEANSKLTTIGQKAFDGAGLTSITIPASVTTIKQGAFLGCSDLTSVTFEANSKLTTIEQNAFCGAGLTSITIPASVTTIEQGVFSGSDLTSITIPASVTTIEQEAFWGCSDLTSVTFEANSKLTTIGQKAFFGCSNLTSVTIPASVTTIGDNAFTGCSDLTNVTVPVTDLAAFCDNSVMYQIKQKIALPVKLVDGEGTEITSYVIPSGVTSIGHYAFYNCTGLTSVTIPSTVTSLGSYSFYNCTGLASVTIPISVPTFGEYTFKNCPLTTVKVPVTDVAAFCNNTLLERIAYYYTEKTIVLVDGEGAEITSVTIPNEVTSIGNSAFRNCTGLASVIAHDNVTSVNYLAFLNTAWYNNLPDGVTYIGKVAYTYKGSAASVTIKDGTTCICSYAFCGNTDLASVIIPKGVTTIEPQAFKDCASLASVTLPDGLTTIGSEAFWNCPALTSIAIPASVTTIGEYALDDCPSVTLYATTPPSSAYKAFMYNDGFRLYVFSDLVETYKGKKSSYNFYHTNNVVAITQTVNDAGGELGNWCTYYNGLADVTVPDGTTIYKAALNSTKNAVILTEVAGNIVKKGEAVLLKSSGNITLSSAASSGTGDYTGNELQGVDVSTPQASGITYYVLSKPAADKAFGFYKLADGTNLAANKAYLVIPATPGARGYIGFDGDDGSTAIEAPEVASDSDDGDIYDLMGRKVVGQPKKGIYVKRGRKFIVK